MVFGLVLNVSVAAAQAPRTVISSGLETGETVEPWRPIHVAGPDLGTTACPVCTYLERPAVIVFTKDGDERRRARPPCGSTRRARTAIKSLRGSWLSSTARHSSWRKWPNAPAFPGRPSCYPDPTTRDDDLRSYKINPAAANTILVYKNYTVATRFVDLSAKDFGQVEAAVAKLVR